MCRKQTISSMRILQKDSHGQYHIRVKGVIENSEEFQKAFNCPSNSESKDKKNRCRIW